MVKDGTEERGKLGIAFACAGDGVDGRLRVGVRAARVGELGVIASAVVGKECAGFVERVVVWNAAELTVELLVGEELGLLVGRGFVKSCDKKNLRGASASFEPTGLVRQLGTLGRVLLEVARVFHDVRFLLAFHDDSAALVAVLFLTVDDFVLFAQCPVNLVERV